MLLRLIKLIRRVHIIGMAVSGKTTPANRLVEILKAPVNELDKVGYEGGSGGKRSVADRQSDLARITEQANWVAEGCFLWWVEPLLEDADAIVWLDLPWRLCWWRIVVRHIKADLARTNRHPGFRRMLAFASGVRHYEKGIAVVPDGADDDDDGANLAAVAQVLEKYFDKVVRCRRPSEVRRFLRRIQDSATISAPL